MLACCVLHYSIKKFFYENETFFNWSALLCSVYIHWSLIKPDGPRYLVAVVPAGGGVEDADLAEGRPEADAGQGLGEGRGAHLQGADLADRPD